MVYDISKPTAPKFATYINIAPTDLAPEGLFFIKEEDSPNGKPLLVVSYEVSNTVVIFEIERDSQEKTAKMTMRMKAGARAIANLLAREQTIFLISAEKSQEFHEQPSHQFATPACVTSQARQHAQHAV